MTQSLRKKEWAYIFGSMENPVQHVRRYRRFAYQSHRKKNSRVAIPYRRRRFRHHQGTFSLRSYQKALYSRRWMNLPSCQEMCDFTLWRMERTETDHPIVGRKRAIAETVSSLVEHILVKYKLEMYYLFVLHTPTSNILSVHYKL